MFQNYIGFEKKGGDSFALRIEEVEEVSSVTGDKKVGQEWKIAQIHRRGEVDVELVGMREGYAEDSGRWRLAAAAPWREQNEEEEVDQIKITIEKCSFKH